MYPYHWTWTYTVLTVLLLLVPFAVVGAVLLARHFLSPAGRVRRSPDSIPTPLGYMSYEQAQHQWPWGVERAREREYHVKGREP